MKQLAVGIDLGTSTSEIAVFRNGDVEPIRDPATKAAIIPSLIALNQRGELLVGEDARDFMNVSGVREIKRRMGSGDTVQLGDRHYRPEELSALILSKLKQNAEVFLGEPVTEVVLSVPANFNDAAKQATVNAAQLAGLNVVRLVNEPTAAALAFGIKSISTEAQLVVFDFGGGTLDVTALEMMEGVLEARSSYGDPKLGGTDFDQAMMELILRKFRARYAQAEISARSHAKLKECAEKAKVDLSTRDTADVRIDYFAIHQGEPLDLEVEVTRTEFEAEVAPLLDRARQCLSQALKVCNLRPEAIDTVLTVGGTTYIPCVRRLVEDFFGKPLKTHVDPDLAVALGAATLAGMQAGLVDAESSLVFSDVCPMGIGIDVVSNISGQRVLVYEALIRPSTPIPYSRTYHFSLLRDDQTEVELNVFQTHLMDDIFPLDLGLSKGLLEQVGLSGSINDIPPSYSGEPHPIDVDFSYDANGIVQIVARIPGVKQEISVGFAHSDLRLNERELAEAEARVRALLAGAGLDETDPPPADPTPDWTDHPLARRYKPLLDKAERLAADQPAHAPKIAAAAARLKNALVASDDSTIDTIADELTDLLFDLQA